MTEKNVVEKTNQDPKLISSVNVAAAQANTDNIDKLMEGADHYKEKIIKMKDTIIKERGEGRDLKRKHETTLSEFERLQKAYQYLESIKDAMDISVTIMEGKKKDLEDKVLELEAHKSAANRQ